MIVVVVGRGDDCGENLRSNCINACDNEGGNGNEDAAQQVITMLMVMMRVMVAIVYPARSDAHPCNSAQPSPTQPSPAAPRKRTGKVHWKSDVSEKVNSKSGKSCFAETFPRPSKQNFCSAQELKTRFRPEKCQCESRGL